MCNGASSKKQRSRGGSADGASSIAGCVADMDDGDAFRPIVDLVEDEIGIAAHREHSQSRHSGFRPGGGKPGQALNSVSDPRFHRSCRTRVLLRDVFEYFVQISLEHIRERDPDARRIKPQHTLAKDNRRRNAGPLAPVVDQLGGFPIGNDIVLDGGDFEIAANLTVRSLRPVDGESTSTTMDGSGVMMLALSMRPANITTSG